MVIKRTKYQLFRESNRGVQDTETFAGLELRIEFPLGFVRKGQNPVTGHWWTKVYDLASYGYIKGMQGTDGDNLDYYLARDADPKAPVFIAHLADMEGQRFEQDKVLLGFDSWGDARAVFDRHTYKAKERFLGYCTFDLEHFRLMGSMTRKGKTIIAGEATVDKLKKAGKLARGLMSPIQTARKLSEALRTYTERMGYLAGLYEADAPLALDFEDDVHGSHHGQLDCTLLAYSKEPRQAVGGIDYTIFDDKIHIQWIQTREGHERRGIGRALIHKLEELHGADKIEWGMTTAAGTALKTAIDRDRALGGKVLRKPTK